MSQTLSIRFQPPEHLNASVRTLVAQLRNPADPAPVVLHDERIEPLALSPSPEQETLNDRAFRQKLRGLEKERARVTVDGTATWILTDRMSLNPDLGERSGDAIVGAGLGKGHIVYGPPDLCLPSGRYMAIIEFQVADMLDNRWARMAGEVILNNRTYLSQQTKRISARGAYVFRLPFRMREVDLSRHATPFIEVRLNLKSIVGVKVTQVAILSRTERVRAIAAHPGAHLRSAGNAWLRWAGRRIVKLRA